MFQAITDVCGIKVGHWTNQEAATGCTVILCEGGAVAGVDVRGSAPGTRETDLLRPMNLVQQIHAVLLSGGSAFGLEAAGGVMHYLEEKGIGFPTGAARVPIVPAAIIYDLSIGSAVVRPGPDQGYLACQEARSGPVEEGSVGAGTGATVAKALGLERAIKGGLGTASRRIGERLVVGALAVVSAFGDVVNPETGETVAGPRGDKGFLKTIDLLQGVQPLRPPSLTNTTLVVVATNAALTKEQANKLAQMAQDGLARALRPAHTMVDGDIVFALSLGEEQGEVTALGAIAAEVAAEAIARGVTEAQGLCGIPSASELRGGKRRA